MDKQHATFLRALTSRLAEVRDIVSLWGRSPAPLHERGYLSSLKQLRDNCHEWTAADVLRSLHGLDGVPMYLELEEGGEEGDCDNSAGLALAPVGGGIGAAAGGEACTALRHGFPQWSWPAYPRCPWLRYTCPVLESLLCSCYEDWLEVGLSSCSALLEALGPMLECAAEATVEDLSPPLEEEQEAQAEQEGLGEVEGKGGCAGRPAAAAAAAERRSMRHLAAYCALEFAQHAGPLVAALTCAAQCPSPATQRTAGSVCLALRKALHLTKHLLG